jgi:hypothetical protein
VEDAEGLRAVSLGGEGEHQTLVAREHAKETHKIEVTPELVEKVKSVIRKE